MNDCSIINRRETSCREIRSEKITTLSKVNRWFSPGKQYCKIQNSNRREKNEKRESEREIKKEVNYLSLQGSLRVENTKAQRKQCKLLFYNLKRCTGRFGKDLWARVFFMLFHDCHKEVVRCVGHVGINGCWGENGTHAQVLHSFRSSSFAWLNSRRHFTYFLGNQQSWCFDDRKARFKCVCHER